MARELLRDKVIAYLKSRGGDVIDPEGISPQRWPGFENHAKSSVSTMLRVLEDEGVIWSEWLTPRLRGRVALTEVFPRPMSVEDHKKEISKRISQVIDEALGDLIEAASDEEWVAEVERLEAENAQLVEQVSTMRERMLEAHQTIQDMTAEINRLVNLVKSVKGSFEKYKETTKVTAKAKVAKAKKISDDFESLVENVAELKNVRMTNHAKRRAAEMELSEAEVMRVISDPDVVYDSRYEDQPHRVYKRGELTVPVTLDGAIKTVLWNKVEQWTREEFRQERQKGG